MLLKYVLTWIRVHHHTRIHVHYTSCALTAFSKHICVSDAQIFFSVCFKETHISILSPPGPLLACSPIIPLVHTTKRPPWAACSPSERRAQSRRRHYGESWFPRGSVEPPLCLWTRTHGAVCVVAAAVVVFVFRSTLCTNSVLAAWVGRDAGC